MKKQLLASLGFVVITATVAMGGVAPGTGILLSPHDMRNAAVGGVDSQARACAFCHTPHHAQVATGNDYYPLWSRQLDTNTFTSYVSSTMNSADFNSDIAIGPTRLCMSCHDGTIAVDQHYGIAGSKLLVETGFPVSGVPSPGVGQGTTGLTNDHPVGMNYTDVAIGPVSGDPDPTTVAGALANQDPWIRKADSTLLYTGNKFNVKVSDRLYVLPTDGTKAYMTCATCHDVHNKKNADLATDPNNLVLAPQKDSALCLTCHIK
jgi:hypothetical protein